MENPEEVLQALDEFQKLRPTEIPRELEDYLCWVAKTGDPVYQWSLIKALFREKLTRVMTDFYESCPSLELTPCPNVEHFNYDSMKSNLLERLESFANAPFTVQRICELLTAPRKEYNRVDKFMRAIEKNILVVSTREPGSSARRSENGDSMVNGSVEEDATSMQPSHEIEMDSWVKDCTTVAGVTVRATGDASLLETVLPSTTVVKSLPAEDDGSTLDKTERVSSESNSSLLTQFVPSTSEFSDVGNLSSQIQLQNSSAASGTQNLSPTPMLVDEVPEAIINEDTSSQPSLDLENEEHSSTDPARKLQTTFQAKDFVPNDTKSIKIYSDDTAPSTDVEKVDTPSVDETPLDRVEDRNVSDKTKSECKESLDHRESIFPMVQNFLQASMDVKIASDETKTTVDGSTDENLSVTTKSICFIPDNSSTESKDSPKEDIKSSRVSSPKPFEDDTISQEPRENVSPVSDDNSSCQLDTEQSDEGRKEDSSLLDMYSKTENLKEIDVGDKEDRVKPVIEEPPSGEPPTSVNDPSTSSVLERNCLTIQETLEDDCKTTKSIVPDPLPIVEEPKESESQVKNSESSTVVVDVTSESVDHASVDELVNKDTKLVVDSTTTDVDSEELQSPTPPEKNQLPETSKTTKCSETEGDAMEVDGEELALPLHHDEPMEEETTDLVKS
ncbi:serine/threonine-protein phosphatase 4 regulatory subunit 2-A [Orussus abietinus]|uniref:serine/threonine-protein phosphatase 4 regulatory subunit 2-A n=1 Tax=Orussus abietinus TaxID=222816 RepID=UPI0006252430|nr:serine/threonine-protein phosphatase 4 regulatory subunit 2-A [Orussus abietinus]